ncbi:basic helix-loop-helix protein [Linnemannia exigua]|uniref:Basic helix-loop-helix protein n=1 Tax=Linnemannia exigua TaxID=604196 RepID=A0AAD4HBW3_9FUNG|nr:basic helix-loop-helix protein [Linnemannia exigua]
MTSSSEIHVQEVLNNLSNSIKRDAEIVDGSSFTAAIAQQDATALPTSLATDLPVSLPAELTTALVADLPVGLPVTIATSIPSQDHNQIGQEQLERIAQQHQQEQAQLQIAQAQAQAQAEQDAQVQAQVQAVQAHVQAHVQAQVAQAHAQQAQEQLQPLQEALIEDSHVIHVNALDSNNSSTLATVPITSVASAVPPPAKPAPGSEEWHRIRRDNHKEVERRRRDNINQGINDLAAVIPNNDKNKGQILRQAVNYISAIQEAQVKMMEEMQNVEAIKFEREQALVAKNLAQAELQNLITQHDELKRNYDALRKEYEDAEEAKKKQRTADEE